MAEEKTTVDGTQTTSIKDNGNTKVRNFSVIVYPDSKFLNPKWRENLELLGHKSIISPIHDKDVFESDVLDENGNIKYKKGDLKKPHYHICVFRKNATTLNSCIKHMKDNIDSSITFVKILSGTIQANFDYMSHKNAPSKAQYNQEEVVCLNGFNPIDYVTQTRSEKINLTKEIYIYIENNGLEEFSDLIQMLIMEEKEDLLEYVSNRAFFVDKILTSIRNKKPQNSKTHKKD